MAFKFAQYLLGYFPAHLLDLVAIGTIADLVPLVNENRILAFHGLRQLSVTQRKGLAALKKCCGLQGEVTEEHVGFQIGPHLNAVGRLQDADLAVQLLMTDNEEEAEELASMVQTLNKERKKIVAEIADEAKNMLLHTSDEDGVIVVAQKGWNEGVLGIVASRLVRDYDRPAIVLSINEETGTAKGSARSIPAFDLFQGCMEVNHLFLNFGGHSQAAGMTLKLENIEKLRNELNGIIHMKLSPEDFKQELLIDAALQPSDVTLELIKEIGRLAPFGMKNNKPVFLLSGIPFGIRKLGNGNKHLKMQFENAGTSIDGIGFGLGEWADFITPNAGVSVAGQLAVNEWNGVRKPQIIMQDLRIDDWQLFDHRGKKSRDMTSYLQRSSHPAVISHTDEIEKGWGLVHVQKTTYTCAESELGQVTDIFLFDLPDDLQQLEKIVKKIRPVNIHACFYVQNSSYLTVFPGRNEFKKLYAYIFKRKKNRFKNGYGNAGCSHWIE
ncbi:single-stranded-DNA-specific exonuclease C-terminal domain-containing protein [Virgibacillus halophilus]|uniref:Single-stranded-DNA-specific exonuclease C-terminal domain-containing protein n=1 Tax=Tigheibacillus halophilus TaxID=361280 RepID=A0ABU5CBZ6_9BACI|nr:single-stranded-DNA-specific exonuclease C-terminal domain-containing protein [Virgibacillus halophilus]